MIHLDGAPKYWCVSPWSERDKLNALMQKLGACCIDEISHVRAFLDPELVAAHGIQVSTCVQGPDTIMVLEPGVGCSLEIWKKNTFRPCIGDSTLE